MDTPQDRAEYRIENKYGPEESSEVLEDNDPRWNHEAYCPMGQHTTSTLCLCPQLAKAKADAQAEECMRCGNLSECCKCGAKAQLV